MRSSILQKKILLDKSALICALFTLFFLFGSYFYTQSGDQNTIIVPFFGVFFSVPSIVISVLSIAFKGYSLLNIVSFTISFLVFTFSILEIINKSMFYY